MTTEVISKLEPEIHVIIDKVREENPLARPDIEALAAVSSAISLKRIADALAGNEHRLGLVDGVMHAIEQGLIAGRN